MTTKPDIAPTAARITIETRPNDMPSKSDCAAKIAATTNATKSAHAPTVIAESCGEVTRPKTRSGRPMSANRQKIPNASAMKHIGHARVKSSLGSTDPGASNRNRIRLRRRMFAHSSTLSTTSAPPPAPPRNRYPVTSAENTPPPHIYPVGPIATAPKHLLLCAAILFRRNKASISYIRSEGKGGVLTPTSPRDPSGAISEDSAAQVAIAIVEHTATTR